MSDEDFGNYVREGSLGSGGMASVFLGRQKPPAMRPVAIKLMHENLAQDPSIVERFKREAAAGAAMQHANIVTYLEYGERDGRPYIVMEFIDGWDLHSWLKKKHKPLPLPVALKVLRDVACALEHAHDKNVIHRDLKPSNVMLSRSGDVKLMDFGLARAAMNIDLTDPGTLLGTAPYMSPEQARGVVLEGEPAKRSDVFSFATVAYELLGGTRPFNGDGLAQVLDAVRHAEPPALSDINPAVPWEIVNLVKQMHVKDPDRRTVGFAVIVQQFERAIDALRYKVDQRFLRAYVEAPEAVSEKIKSGNLGEFMKVGLEESDPTLPAPKIPGVAPEKPTARPAARTLPKSHSKPPLIPTQLVVPIAGILVALIAVVVLSVRSCGKGEDEKMAVAEVVVPKQEPVVSRPVTPATTGREIDAPAQANTPTDNSELPPRQVVVDRSTSEPMAVAGPPSKSVGVPGPPPEAIQQRYVGTFELRATRGDVTIEVDGKPYEFPDKIRLAEGEHPIRLTFNGEPITLKYIVQRNDPAKTLILDYEKRSIERRFEALN